MITKKLFLGMFIFIASSEAFAGGVSIPTSIPVETDNTSSRFYIEGSAGWNQNYYKNTIETDEDVLFIGANRVIRKSTRGNGTGVFGGDVGYKWNNYFSTEIGGFWNLSQKYDMRDIGGPNPDNFRIKIKSQQAYASVNISIPIYENLRVLGKLGIGYQKVKYSITEIYYKSPIFFNSDNDNESHVGPIFGLAMHYNWTSNTYLIGEYMRFGGKYKMPNQVITHTNMLLLGLGYMFAT